MDRLLAPPISRSELIARRRHESSSQLQNQYDTWEVLNPVWAKRLTGPDAARALGYGGTGECEHASYSDLVTSRRLRQRAVAYESSGFSHEIQAKLTAHDPQVMVTSITRETVLGGSCDPGTRHDPSLTWVGEPKNRSRTELMQERRRDNVVTLDAQKRHHDDSGKLDAEGRVQVRIDQSIALLQQASAAGSKSRAELLDMRRRERAEKALSDYEAFKPPQPPRYTTQEKPFWTIDRKHQQQAKQQQEELEAAREKTGILAASMSASMPQVGIPLSVAPGTAAKPPAIADPASRTASTLGNGSVSAEMFNGRRKWWMKPEHYPKAAPAQPMRDDPFKLAADDVTFLDRKLSSGAKKQQRGYPPDQREIADKITALPPPSLADAIVRDPFQQYSGAAFKFLPHEPREMKPGASDTNAEGYEFTLPRPPPCMQELTTAPPFPTGTNSHCLSTHPSRPIARSCRPSCLRVQRSRGMCRSSASAGQPRASWPLRPASATRGRPRPAGWRRSAR
jgi:hypothetical protein